MTSKQLIDKANHAYPSAWASTDIRPEAFDGMMRLMGEVMAHTITTECVTNGDMLVCEMSYIGRHPAYVVETATGHASGDDLERAMQAAMNPPSIGVE